MNRKLFAVYTPLICSMVCFCKGIRRMSLFVLLFLLSTSIALQAQKVNWETGYPKLSSETLGALGDPAVLELKFTVTEKEAASGKVVVTLPTGVNYKSVAAGSSNNVTYTIASAGNVHTFTITSDGGKLVTGKLVDLNVSIDAACAEGNLSITVDVQSGTASLVDAKKTIPVRVEKPAIRIIPVNASVSSATVGTKMNFDLALDVSNNVKAGSFKIVLTKESSVTLEDFKLDGVSLSTVSSTATAVTITLNNINLTSTAKHLTFTASAIYAGTRTITSQIQYTSSTGVACGTAVSGPPITISYPSVPGSATLQLFSSAWVHPSDLDGGGLNSMTQISMNGVDPSCLKLVYTNYGTAPTAVITQTVSLMRSTAYTLGYVDVSNIQYSVDGGVTKKKIGTDNNLTLSNPLSDSNGYFSFKPSAVGKYHTASISVKEPLLPEAKLVVYWPFIQGDIYDNSTYKPTVSSAGHPWASIQWANYTITATDANGATVGVPANTYGIGGIGIPRFVSSPVPASLRAGDSDEQNLYIDVGTLDALASVNQTADLFIKFPDWVEFTELYSGGGLFNPTTTDAAQNLYSFRYTTLGARNITVKYKAKSGMCSGENRHDEIEYWLNYNLGGNNPSLRPVLKQIAKVFQPVTLLCEEEGVIMQSFKLKRATKDLKDSNNNKVPDSNTPAPDEDILHNVYLTNDKGELFISGEIGDGNYNHLYTVISGINLSLANFSTQNATIQVGTGAADTVSLTKVSNANHYIKYEKTLKKGDRITITIPFQVTSALNDTKAFKAECYVTNSAVSDPLTPGISRVGKDEMYQPVTAYSEGFARDVSGAANITDNAVITNFTHGYFDNYHGNNFQSPYFSKEYRTIARIVEFVINLPAGYRLRDASAPLLVSNSATDDAHTSGNKSQTRSNPVIEKNLDGSSKYTYDLTPLFDVNCTNETDYGQLPSNKWIYPDDRFVYNFYSNLQATKGAVPAGNVTTTVKYYRPANNNTLTSYDHSRKVNYTGPRTDIKVSSTSVTAYGKPVTIPVVSVGNPTDGAIRIWLYTTGNINGSSIRKPDATVVNGTGLNGRWIPLGSFAKGTSVDYTLTCLFNSVSSAGESVQIYTVSDFGDVSWSPNVSAAIDLEDIDHLGSMTYVTAKPTSATIDGSITSNATLVFNTPYTVTAELTGSSSECNLNTGQMEISVPAGQKYVAGSARYVYPAGTAPKAVPTAVETTLLNALGKDATLDGERTYVFKVADFIADDELPGYRLAPDDNNRRIQLQVNFTPQCATSLMGIRFSGILKGKNISGIDALNTNKVVRSAELFSNISSDYLFNVVPKFASGISAFNEVKTEENLVVELENYFGSIAQMATSDYMQLQMPKSLNVKTGSQLVVSSTELPSLQSKTLSVSSNAVSGDTRTIWLTMPVDALKALGTNALNKKFYCTLPLVYTPNGQTMAANPVHSVVATAVTYKKFSESCPATPLPIGTGECGVALLTAQENPAGATVGIAKALSITSAGFAGKWYANSSTATALSATSAYTYTPGLQIDTAFYVSAEFGGVNYGRVPVQVKVFPGLTFTHTPATICYGKSIDLTTTVTGVAAGVTLKFYSDQAATQLLANTVVSPVSTSSYYIQTSNANGDKSAVKELVITVRPQVVAGVLAGNPYFSTGTAALPIIGAQSTGGSNSFTYQWYSSTDGVNWTLINGAKSKDYSPGFLTGTTHFRRASEDANCGVFYSNVFTITRIDPSTSVLYWKQTAADHNWYNLRNWQYENGSPADHFPLACTKVHIPGGAGNYPSLEDDEYASRQGAYGAPVCDEIVFHYGGEISFPHKLEYRKAYIRYNLGYYGGGLYGNGIINSDANSSAPIDRDKWMMLAAPLKEMVSGDFSFGGYPFSYQALYNTKNPATGELLEGRFSGKIAGNDRLLSTTNHAIAINVAGYMNETGKNNHHNLEKLGGILEIPYYENAAVAPYHPGHYYDSVAGTSTFYYFDSQTLQQVHTPVGSLPREGNAYRFVFEAGDNKIREREVNGSIVPCYTMNVACDASSANRSVMIGNPFMSYINTKNFFTANSGKLNFTEGYKVYNNTTSLFERYEYNGVNNIPPLQAFIVTLTSNSAELLFPLEGMLALTSPSLRGSSRMAPAGESLYLRVGVGEQFDADYAVLNRTASGNTTADENVQKIVSAENNTTPEVFFINDKQFNQIQNVPETATEIKLGVRSSNLSDLLTLEFSNSAEFAFANGLRLWMVDRKLQLIQDLQENNVYQFYQQQVGAETQYADMDRFVLRLLKSGVAEDEGGIQIAYKDKKLTVTSYSSINKVEVYDIKGSLLFSSGRLNTMSIVYEKNLPLPAGGYVVRVETDKESVARKMVSE